MVIEVCPEASMVNCVEGECARVESQVVNKQCGEEAKVGCFVVARLVGMHHCATGSSDAGTSPLGGGVNCSCSWNAFFSI